MGRATITGIITAGSSGPITVRAASVAGTGGGITGEIWPTPENELGA
jgi:hypothetical protein